MKIFDQWLSALYEIYWFIGRIIYSKRMHIGKNAKIRWGGGSKGGTAYLDRQRFLYWETFFAGGLSKGWTLTADREAEDRQQSMRAGKSTHILYKIGSN